MRAPTAVELEELAAIVAEGMGDEIEYARDALSGSHIGVIDNYITDGPGWFGKLAVVVWSGSPELVDTYGWNEGGGMQLFTHQGDEA